ncbi:MAG TPA: hypothetical protein VGM92_00980 [Candidatus Kapabacteria bacterium]|jgi:uncharacterized membrane protein YeaQ/YmgE (transglycosylase-associated protein family)
MIFLWSLLIGIVLGGISGLFTPRRDPGTIVVRAIVGLVFGIIGALVSTIVFPHSDFALWISIVCIAILLVLYSLTLGKRPRKKR